MTTQELIESVAETQALVLKQKSDEIKRLEEEVRTLKSKIEDLEIAARAPKYQMLLDQIQNEFVNQILDKITSGKETRTEMANEGDVLNFRGAQVKLERFSVEEAVDVTSMALDRDLRAKIALMSLKLTSQLSAREYSSMVFNRQPLPLPGTGAIFATNPSLGLRAILSYDPRTLLLLLHVDVLVGGVR